MNKKIKELRVNPYKNHEHDGGDDYGLVDCLKCEAEMLWNLRMNSRKLDIFPKHKIK